MNTEKTFIGGMTILMDHGKAKKMQRGIMKHLMDYGFMQENQLQMAIIVIFQVGVPLERL